ncbi:hypothetical protein [Methylobrevis pamukkalensis]|uniref:Uncharacterized protein n=1 Tax=Methylobrevis pamukkalensis TaxID=1439726 RepID=A0A1E3GZ11_9HYPH|nr:hypothetical protein [Methylobrevis pamukkalensis]ODN69272.1 hypothetical protein A6302_03430 [Methylobrevis pamukkalensis]
MRKPFLIVGIAILVTALGILLLSGGDRPIAGVDPDDFARLAQLSAILLLAGSALVYSRTSRAAT